MESICRIFRLLSFSPRSLLFHLLSPAIIHGIVQYCFASSPSAGPLSFATSFLSVNSCFLFLSLLIFLLQCNHILKELDQPPLSFVDMSFLFFTNPANKRWHATATNRRRMSVNLSAGAWPSCCVTPPSSSPPSCLHVHEQYR